MFTSKRKPWLPLLTLVVCGGLWGCETPSAHTTSRDYSQGDTPVDPPQDSRGFEDRVGGGQLFQMYCGACHNARALGERPFSNYEVATAHMREQAYLTGTEYRKILHFLRRWHEVGPPTPEVTPSPRRFFFSQPVPELRPRDPEPRADRGSGSDADAPPHTEASAGHSRWGDSRTGQADPVPSREPGSVLVGVAPEASLHPPQQKNSQGPERATID